MIRPAVRTLARPWVLIAAVAVGATACSSYVKRGSALYAEGRYVEAAEVFERTEHRLRDSSPRECAEYGLYRGLTLLVLGDLRNAHRWLTYAYQVERVCPGSLRGNGRALLDRAWYELGKLMRPPAQPAQPDTALAASRPPPAMPAPQPAPRPPAGATQRSLAPSR
jgi:tetratricopeptide (TPR) repeat protein